MGEILGGTWRWASGRPTGSVGLVRSPKLTWYYEYGIVPFLVTLTLCEHWTEAAQRGEGRRHVAWRLAI